jgi:hypothetical protein
VPHLPTPRQPSVVLKSPLHAQSLVLVTLRILIAVTGANDHLANYRPLVSELLVSAWPSPCTLRPVEAAAVSRKGKERAQRGGSEELEEAHERVERARMTLATQWLSLAERILQEAVAVDAAKETEVLATKVFEEFREQLINATSSPSGRDRQLATEWELQVLRVVARLWMSAREGGKVEGNWEDQAEEAQLVRTLFEAEGGHLVDVAVAEGDSRSTPLRVRFPFLLFHPHRSDFA